MRENKTGYRRRTGLASVQYTKPKKNPVPLDERRKEKASLKITNIYTGGGDDCA